MKGGVRKRGATWSYYYELGIIDGKRKKKEKGGFVDKPTAEKALREAIYNFENGGYIEPKKTKFTEFALEWLEKYVKPMRKISTYNRYHEIINKYLTDSIGSMNIIDIQSYHIEQLLLKYHNDLSGSTRQGIYTIINTIMNRALKLKVIKDNPCKYVERPKRIKFTPEVLTPKEIQKIYDALDLKDKYDYVFYIGLKLTLELGIRRGELGGLEWHNINFEENTIMIKNNLIYSNGHVYMLTPKTQESNRSIYISNDVLELLKKYHIKQSKDKLSAGEFYEKNIFNNKEYDLVMKWNDGKYVHPMYYLNKIKKVLKKANIEKSIRFHDLRHTNATLLLQEGIDLKIIQERLGHKDISTTSNIYSHVNKEMQKAATEKLNNLFGGKPVAKQKHQV